MRTGSAELEAEADGPPRAARDDHPLVWTTTTYFAEGLPWSLLHQVAAEFFTAIGLPARQVGYTSALHVTGSLKFLWSPLVDLFGTLRLWMIATQAAMGLAVGYLALHAQRLEALGLGAGSDTTWVWAALVIVGVLSATHDIACDGYYMDALDKDAQARYSGLRIAAFRIAMLVGNAGLVYIGGRFGWLAGFGCGAAMLLALAVFHHFQLPRGASERAEPDPAATAEANDPRGSAAARARHVAAAYLSFLGQRSALVVLLFITTYKLGDALMFSMGKVLLRELGVGTETRALINLVSVLSMIAGATFAGAWIARARLARALLPITLIMALSEPLYLLLASATVPMQLGAALEIPASLLELYRPSIATITGVLAIEQFAGGMATTAQMIFIMRRCHPDHKAAHYAFATALYAFAQMATGTYSGLLYEAQGPLIYFSVTSVVCIPALVLVNLIPTSERAR